jgi:acyl carrier protein
MSVATLDRATSVQVVIASLREVLTMNDEAIPAVIDEETVLVGSNAVLDSLGVVALIVEVEQRLEIDYSVSVTLANDRAMSQRNSPFRTVGVLSDYICAMIKEG